MRLETAMDVLTDALSSLINRSDDYREELSRSISRLVIVDGKASNHKGVRISDGTIELHYELDDENSNLYYGDVMNEIEADL